MKKIRMLLFTMVLLPCAVILTACFDLGGDPTWKQATMTFNMNGSPDQFAPHQVTIIPGLGSTYFDNPSVQWIHGRYPIWEFHVFNGWFTHATGGTPIAWPIDTRDQDMTVFAQWTPYKTVSFDLQQGTGTFADLRIHPNQSTATAPVTEPTREFHVFNGWFTTATGNTSFDFSNITSSTTVFAQWTAYHTISLNTHGAGNIADIRVRPGDVAEMPAAPMRSLYTFTGWTTDAQGNVPFVPNAITGDITLHAQWTPYTSSQLIVGNWRITRIEAVGIASSIQSNPQIIGEVYVEFGSNGEFILNIVTMPSTRAETDLIAILGGAVSHFTDGENAVFAINNDSITFTFDDFGTTRNRTRAISIVNANTVTIEFTEMGATTRWTLTRQ
jgi:uncharacterized repeat protein (TIGR02543 family)